MKVWVNLNVTFDLDYGDQQKAYEELTSICANTLKEHAYEAISFKSGEDSSDQPPIALGRKSYTSYNES